MASVSLVGQQPGPHSRLDSEPQILYLKLSSSKTKSGFPRKSSWDKMVFMSGGDTQEEPRNQHPLSRGPGGGGAAAEGRRMSRERCGAPAVSEAPRSPEQSGERGSDGVTAGTRLPTDAGSDVKKGASHRRTDSLKETKHKRSHRQRDSPHQRRNCRSGDSGQEFRGLTRGRTGVVKLARTEPHRREAWSIFPREMDPRVRTERGEGHRFESKPVKQDWCDACSHQITAQALKCQNCSYTCHLECESQVQLDCNQRDRQPGETRSPTNLCTRPHHKQSEKKEEEAGGTPALSEEEVHARIEEYNAQVSNHGMNLASDGSYTGFVQVHLRLSRPVTVQAVEKAGSEGGFSHSLVPSEEQEETDCGPTEKRTSFYLPQNYITHLHISSLNTTEEVIKGLLKKFEVKDNPRKFALYKQTHRNGQDLFQKLPLTERPLPLRLIAGPDTEQLSFVFKENETEEVEWHAFSIPELQNFLIILGKEESERIRAVEQKYTLYREKLQQALQQHDP
ncbi:ras association domain-containing protein 5 isoform X1 [Oryzias latipes]|uniref:ras association domain-containing protein 5 isoform X1 n=1 Tax=Oryzias latipes TaxID=8090 RepID=UPI0009D9DC86|nr:ras association domain-containing protein 5 isoform X1 [Oryzias latipes]